VHSISILASHIYYVDKKKVSKAKQLNHAKKEEQEKEGQSATQLTR
jgi:hypothetical protein